MGTSLLIPLNSLHYFSYSARIQRKTFELSLLYARNRALKKSGLKLGKTGLLRSLNREHA